MGFVDKIAELLFRIDQICRNNSFGYLILNREGLIIGLSEEAANLLGYKLLELKGKKLQSFLDKPSIILLDELLLFRSQLKGHVNEVLTIQGKDGLSYNILIDVTKMQKGEKVKVEIVDIHQSGEVNRKVEEESIDCKVILEDLKEGIAILDENQKFVYVNSAMGSIFGTFDSQLVGRCLYDFIDKDAVDNVRQSGSLKNNNDQNRYILDIIGFDGIHRAVLVSESPYQSKSGNQTNRSAMLFIDITIHRQNEKEIQKRLDMEMVVSDISNDFVRLNKNNLDESVKNALCKIGEFAGVDRTYIFLFSEDGQFCNNTHEWCREGISSELENLQQVPIDAIPWWMSILRRFETIHIPSVSNLPPDAKNEREILEAQNIQSVLVIPLLTSNRLIGFLGFDSVSEIKNWAEEDIVLLKMLGNILGDGFARIDYEENLFRVNEQLEQKVEERTRDILKLTQLNKAIVDNADIIIVSTDQHGMITSMNPFAEKILGYSADELVGNSTPLVFHTPQNRLPKPHNKGTKSQHVQCSRMDIVSRVELQENQIRESILFTKEGKGVNVLMSSRSLKDDSGKIIGYVGVAIDITERKKIEKNAFLIRDLGFSLAAITKIEEVSHLILPVVLSLENIRGVGFFMKNSQTNEMELINQKGFSVQFAQAISKYKPNFSQLEAIQSGQPAYGHYNEFQFLEFKSSFEENMVGIIPINHEGEMLGSLYITIKEGVQLSDPAKVTLEIIASQIGGTIARINTENALKITQDNFRLMFDTITEFVFILDKETRILVVNPVVINRLGYSKEELIGKSVLDVHPPERRDEALHIVIDMLAGKREFCPIPLYKKDGGTIPVETKVVPGKWNGEDVLYGISRDVSERIKAEETLRESERRWNFALEGAGDGVWDWNVQTNEVFFSKQWKRMLGYEPDEIQNDLKEWEDRIHPDDREQCYYALNKHFSMEIDIYVNEHRLRCKDGSYKWILDRGKVVERNDTGDPTRLIGTHTDITRSKEMEERLLMAIEKEKELGDLKSRFVSTASHEFRTPLASMLMLSETLIAYQKRMDESQIADKLGKIKSNVLHLTNIVNDVLQLSKIQERNSGFNPSPEDIVSICQSIVDDFNTTITADRKIHFNSNRKKIIVQVDRRIITQAISNLLSNAVKYTINDPEISLDLTANKREWMICVKDNGIGISEKDQKHLFDPFYRADNAAEIQGNGLGLSIVLESVNMHHGKIEVESELMKGSKFTLRFPLTLNPN